jgi:HEAT repeat protein
MNMSIGRMAGTWFESAPWTGEIDRLIDSALYEMNPSVRIRAIIALGESRDPRAVRALVHCSGDQDAEIREHATDALCTLKSGRAAEALIARLGDKNERLSTRRRAADALAAIRSFTALEALKNLATDTGEDADLRSYAARLTECFEKR